MYSESDIVVREIGGSIWFMTSFWLDIAFMSYVIRETARDSKRDRTLISAALALSIYFCGSMLRGFITWMQFFYARQGWDTDTWVATWPLYGSSVLLNIVGASLCFWLLSSWRWRALFTTCAVVASLVAPFALRLVVYLWHRLP